MRKRLRGWVVLGLWVASGAWLQAEAEETALPRLQARPVTFGTSAGSWEATEWDASGRLHVLRRRGEGEEVSGIRLERWEDRDGDGRFELAVDRLAPALREVTGDIRALRLQGEDAYALVGESLWRWWDEDGDGVLESRLKLLASPVSAGEAGASGPSLTGLQLGEEGWVYASVRAGSGVVQGLHGERFHLAHCGGVLRCLPNGDGLEWVGIGFHDPRAMAMDAAGNLFVADSVPDGTSQTRLHWVLPGSDAGWRAYFGDAGDSLWQRENLGQAYFWGQTASLTPRLRLMKEAIGSMVFQPGTLLGEGFENHLLLGKGARAGVGAFPLRATEDGVGYLEAETQEVFSDAVVTTLHSGADGSLYAEGRRAAAGDAEPSLWRLDVGEEVRDEMRSETARWLGEEWRRLPEGRLLSLLGYPDMRVRGAAQREIVRRGDFTILRQTAVADSRKIARIHGIRGCAALASRNEGESLQGLASLARFRDRDIRREMVRAMGHAKAGYGLGMVTTALFDSHPGVRLEAALAMHGLAGPKDFKDITDFIEANGEEDVYRRHAGVHALLGAARGWPELLGDLRDHTSVVVRLSAVVALRRMHEGAVIRGEVPDQAIADTLVEFLDDSSETVCLEVARALHDVPVPGGQGMEALAARLGKQETERGPLLRRWIHANRRLGTEASAERLLRFASRGDVPPEWRLRALASAATWSQQRSQDPVMGRLRGLPKGDREGLRRAWQRQEASLRSSEGLASGLAELQAVMEENP